MKNMRAFAVLTFATLLSACGEGLPETAELTDPQQEPGQEQEVPGDEQDVQTLTDYTFIAPQETRSFASLLFHRTAVYEHGRAAGRTIVLHKPVNAPSGGARGRLLPPAR